jgi:NAD+ synthase (glutamine-hydrolysing)
LNATTDDIVVAMKIALAQINPTLGDFVLNSDKILQACQSAVASGCELVVLPELALMGYLPNDLLERPTVIEAQLAAFKDLKKKLPKKLAVLLGLITKNTAKSGKAYFNSAAFIDEFGKAQFFHKELLPTYDIFDEGRHIEKGSLQDHILRWRGNNILITICEDIWGWKLPGHASNYLHNPLLGIKKKIDLVLNLSASPYTNGKWKNRSLVVSKTAKHFKAPMVYVNLVGSQDEVIFDGGSYAVDSRGKTLVQSNWFSEDLRIIDMSDILPTSGKPKTGQLKLTKEARKFSEARNKRNNEKTDSKPGDKVDIPPKTLSSTEAVRAALVLGISDFCKKTGLTKVHLGLSGGIDSALVACLAVDALGAENVKVIAMPGPFSDPKSLRLAKQLAENLKVELFTIDINSVYQETVLKLDQAIGKTEFSVMQENIQARVRGLLLMAFANREGSLLLTTGNKSEYATGYSTLYGDMCGGLAPLGDLLKRDVYEISRLYNIASEIIPNEILVRPPSAELRPNQKDQDSLPAYDVLDAAVEKIVERSEAAESEVEKDVLKMLLRSEFKRWQAPPILKVTAHAFGRGRRMPIAHRARF